MQQKWISKFMGYDLIVEYMKGRENQVVDALSRQGRETEITISIISFPNWNWMTKIKALYMIDDKTQVMREKHE